MMALSVTLTILALYALPSIVAFKRKHKSKMAILIVNLFLGWTLVGWVIALAWSFTA